MKLKNLLFFALGVLTMNTVSSQGYHEDALLFSRTNAFGSTARIQGIGGSQIALGGDVSSAGSNPAGLGFFNRSVFSFTPGAFFHNNDAIYNSRLVTSYQPNINLPNMGLVLNHSIGDIPDEKFKGGSFAISVTRINDFNQEFAYEGRSAETSIADSFLDNAAGILPSNLGEYEFGAYSTYLIDDPDGEYVTYAGIEPLQNERVTTSGGQNQINFSWGGNYNDQIYFGAGLGIQTLRYRRERFYTESDYFYTNAPGPLSSLVIQDELEIWGTGINGTFGMILRPVPFVTVGVSYVTPTYYGLKDETGFIMNTNWNNFQYDDSTILSNEEYTSVITRSNYNLRTPGKLSLGTALFLGKHGFISGDIEFVDHASAQLQSNDVEFSMNDDNELIRTAYKSVVNYRMGGEFRLDDFRFRGGYAYMADPYANSTIDRSRQNITFGVGFRQQDFFVDLAVVRTLYDEFYSPYTLADQSLQPEIQIKNENTSVSATIGFNF